MGLHSELNIYKVAADLASVALDLITNMPRPVKKSIGEEMRDEILRMPALIFRANVASDKRPHLLQLVERVQVLEFMLRLCRDKQFISIGQYAKVIKLTDSVGKQANAWRGIYGKSPVT